MADVAIPHGKIAGSRGGSRRSSLKYTLQRKSSVAFLMTLPLILLIGVLVIYIVANFGIGYILLQVGLSLLQAWEASVITLTLPLFATFFAVLLLHESLTLLQIIGGCIILVGGFLVI